MGQSFVVPLGGESVALLSTTQIAAVGGTTGLISYSGQSSVTFVEDSTTGRAATRRVPRQLRHIRAVLSVLPLKQDTLRLLHIPLLIYLPALLSL